MISNTAGAMSSQRNSGCAKRTVPMSKDGSTFQKSQVSSLTEVFKISLETSNVRLETWPLPLADLLATLAGLRIVLALVAALRDDHLELAHLGLRRRSARVPVQRRAGRQVALLERRLLRG